MCNNISMTPVIKKLLIVYKNKYKSLSKDQITACAREIKVLENLWELHAVNFVENINEIMRISDPKDYEFVVGELLEKLDVEEQSLLSILVEGIEVLDKCKR